MRLARPAGLAAQPAAREIWLAGRCAPRCGVATLKAAIGEGPGLEGRAHVSSDRPGSGL